MTIDFGSLLNQIGTPALIIILYFALKFEFARMKLWIEKNYASKDDLDDHEFLYHKIDRRRPIGERNQH